MLGDTLKNAGLVLIEQFKVRTAKDFTFFWPCLYIEQGGIQNGDVTNHLFCFLLHFCFATDFLFISQSRYNRSVEEHNTPNISSYKTEEYQEDRDRLPELTG